MASKQRDLAAMLASELGGNVGKAGKWPEVAAKLGDDLAQFEAWLDDPAGPPAAALARVLRRLGIDISGSTVQKWASDRRRPA